MIKSNVKIYRDIPVNQKELIRYMRCTEDTVPEAALGECMRLAASVFTYQVCYRECEVLYNEDGAYVPFFDTPSKTLAMAMRGAERCIVFAATIGHGIDRLIQQYGVRSPLYSLILDAYANERIESLCDVFSLECSGATRRVSAGYGDIPLEMQTAIVSYLAPECIGLTLNESLLLSPLKSVTALMPVKE